jgi:AraC family transcriptional regulator, arabinose operon regulatory protein
MPQILGTPEPVFPSAGSFHSRGEAFTWTEFSLRHWNLYFTLSGSGVAWGPWGDQHLLPGTLVLFPPALERAYRVESPAAGWDFYWMHFRPDAGLRQNLDGWGLRRSPRLFPLPPGMDRDRTAADLEEILSLQLGLGPTTRRRARVAALLQALLLRAAEAGQAGPRADASIARVLDALHRDLAAPRDLATLASVAGLSRSQFCARFRAATGLAPMAYLEVRRLEWARFLLQATADGIGQIGARVGFPDPYHFSRRFRARHGLSPRALRRSGSPFPNTAVPLSKLQMPPLA